MKKNIFTVIIIVFIISMSITLSICMDNGKEKENNTIIISQKEKELEKIREENSSTRNEKEKLNDDEIIKNITKDKVLLKEAQKEKISLSQEDIEQIKTLTNNSISEEGKEKIKKLDMTEDEFREYLYNELVNMELRIKIQEKLIKEINSNNITLDNKEFKEKVAKYNDDKKNNIYDLEMGLNLLNEYIKLLEDNYNIIEQ